MASIDFSARTGEFQELSIHGILTAHAQHHPNEVALASPNRKPLHYGRLLSHVEEMGRILHAMGIGRKDRVALVLPNGPEFLSAFLAVTSVATCAPLNQGFHANELDYYLSDLKAKYLMTLSGEESQAIQVARARGISILEISPLMDEEAGLFQLGESRPAKTDPGLVHSEDLALLLHTSGTTSRPKIVPLTQDQICRSALQIAKSLQLNSGDRCLNVMPLFHNHGLIIASLSSLLSGGSLFCAPKFYPDQFFKWFENFSPTWFTAAPTIHHALFDLTESHPEISKPGPLRVIRSSAASLPPQLHTKLEDTFGIPVIEGYGMTECCLIASNPLPPQKRKRGSVGIAADLEVAIMNETGEWLGPNVTGEVVVRGAGRVIRGYENHPQANAEAFRDGWFRTGDLGYFDNDGYLYIKGRVKEIINRGGEKISPREIDEVILDHPAVAHAVTFPVPHPRLGEDIAAAVVLRKNRTSSPQEIRKFVASQLIDYKVPSVIRLLDEIPKGSTGKFLRIGLAEKLGLTRIDSTHPEVEIPHPGLPTQLLEQVRGLCALTLKRETVGLNDNFFQLGGDSIMATQLVSRLRKEFQLPLTLSTVFEAPTVTELSERIHLEKKKALVSLAENFIPISRNVQEDRFEGAVTPAYKHTKELQFSLFFFSADGSTNAQSKYRLLMESAKFADQNGFAAIWTPERHFHAFGGLYPNPSVLGAALAAITQKIQIRAGSVVLPLQNPLRIAEEWSVVDNLSGGRVAIACASGWHANDFVFAPQDYPDRRGVMMEKLEILKKLWDGQTIKLSNGAGKEIDVRIYPKPLQKILPIWLTSHSDQTFIKAGEKGFNVLTALWSTTEEEIARQILLYREARTRNGHDPEKGIVTLMLHTFVGETMSSVLDIAKSAYGEYLFVNLGLQKDQVEGQNLEFNLTEEDRHLIVSNATERLFKTRGLIGTPATSLDKLNALRSIGVNEIACLIDFGIDFDSVMMSLYHLNKLKKLCNVPEV